MNREKYLSTSVISHKEKFITVPSKVMSWVRKYPCQERLSERTGLSENDIYTVKRSAEVRGSYSQEKVTLINKLLI